jgi:hypothetical protein
MHLFTEHGHIEKGGGKTMARQDLGWDLVVGLPLWAVAARADDRDAGFIA